MAATAAFQGIFKQVGTELVKDPGTLVHKLEKAAQIIGHWLDLLLSAF